MTRKTKKDIVRFNKIKVVLAEQDKSQLWLAESTGLHTNTISGICTNRNQPSPDAMYSIAFVLKVEVGELWMPIAKIDCTALIAKTKS